MQYTRHSRDPASALLSSVRGRTGCPGISYCLPLPSPPSCSLFIFFSICAKLLWTSLPLLLLLLLSPLGLLLARSPTEIAVPLCSRPHQDDRNCCTCRYCQSIRRCSAAVAIAARFFVCSSSATPWSTCPCSFISHVTRLTSPVSGSPQTLCRSWWHLLSPFCAQSFFLFEDIRIQAAFFEQVDQYMALIDMV